MITQRVLLNLLKYPPSEGSRSAHEAWKMNVMLLVDLDNAPKALTGAISQPGYVTKTCRDAAMAYAEVLTKTSG